MKFDDSLLFGFHRLAIVGTNQSGDQPLFHPNDKNLVLICNGEIYNYINLAEKYDFSLKTGSDCEIILHMYKKFGIEQTIKSLDGVFIFEEPYLGSMFEKTSYDQIYDEHIYMFSAHSIKKIFELYHFDLIDLKRFIKIFFFFGPRPLILSRDDFFIDLFFFFLLLVIANL